MTTKQPVVVETVELDTQQLHQWKEGMKMLEWTAPGFNYLWYKMLCKSQGEYIGIMTKAVPVAATDAQNVLINPDTFFKYKVAERVFIKAHEILHVMFGDVELLHKCNASGRVPMHDGTTLPFDNMTMQIAMDKRNNAILTLGKIGSRPKDAIWEPSLTGKESVLDIYQKDYKAKPPPPPGGGKPGDQPGQGPLSNDVLPPGQSTGKDPQEAAEERNPGQWEVEMQAARRVERDRSCGREPGFMERFLTDILEPEAYWVDHIRTVVARQSGSGAYDWEHPDPVDLDRDLYTPGRTGHGAGWIVIWGDTSGSMGSAAEITKAYIGEVAGIIEDVNPRRLSMVWNDAKVDRVDELDSADQLRNLTIRGGGGTDVDPVLKWIDEQYDMPDMFIAFTDGYLRFPSKAPRYPVIWASTTKEVEYPWGEVVRINQKKDKYQ